MKNYLIKIVIGLFFLLLPSLQAQTLIQVGNGTTNTEGTTAINNNWTVYQYWCQRPDGFNEYLITASELAAAGVEPGNKIKSIGYFHTSTNIATFTPGELSIYMFNEDAAVTAYSTTASTANPNFRNTSLMQLVKTDPNFLPLNYGSSNSWHMFELDNEFEYTGGALAVRFCVCRNGGNTSTTSGKFNVMGTIPATHRVISGNTSAGTVGFCVTPNNVGGMQNFLPNFMFEVGVRGPKILSVLPGEGNSFMKGQLLNNNSLAVPKFSFEVGELPDDYPTMRATYKIIGPDPLTEVVYEMVDPNDPSKKYIDFDKTDGVGATGLIDYSVERATGLMVWTGTGADNKSLDLRNMTLKAGQYKSVLSIKAQSADPMYSKPTIKENTFVIRTQNDLSVETILSPGELKDYPSGGLGIPISCSIKNMGMDSVTAFSAQAKIYNVDYDQYTGDVTLGGLVYTSSVFEWSSNGATIPALQTGDAIILDERNLGSYTPTTIGYFITEISVWYTDEDIIDQEQSNNVYPRSGLYHVSNAQYELSPEIVSIDLPADGFETTLGRTVKTSTSFRNTGLVDLSETDDVRLITTIYKKSALGDYTNIVWSNRYLVYEAPTGGGIVQVLCVDSDMNEVGWLVDEVGDFQLITEIDWSVRPITKGKADTVYFSVKPGLHGTIQIGKNKRFKTINEAVDSLYYYGVTAPVTFELTDTEYIVGDFNLAKKEAPALDFRSKIAGVYTVKSVEYPVGSGYFKDTITVNPIKFMPSFEKSNIYGSIRIDLQSNTGMGICFGTSDSSSIDHALVNIVDDEEKKVWAKSDGYITFDGGKQKSFRFSMKMPATSGNEYEFRAPFYLGNAENITIKHCIIEDGVNQPRSLQYLLPGNTYNAAVMSWLYDYERNTGVLNSTYSSGIIIRTLPPYQDRYLENRLKIDTVISSNNVISGNEISKFTYGITSIGLNYVLAGTPFLIDVKDTLYTVGLDELRDDNTLVYVDLETDNSGDIETKIYVYKYKTNTAFRGELYYKYYEVRNTVSGSLLQSFTVLVDSSLGGVRRVYNHDNLIENNLIYDIGRAGIFLGNEEKSIIRGNRIHGVTGEVVNQLGVRVDSIIDCAGILLGGRQREGITDGFSNIGIQIYNNEISNIKSMNNASGIKIEQTLEWDYLTSPSIRFPDAKERFNIYGNVIWGILPGNMHVDRYGINMLVSSRSRLDTLFTAADTTFYATADDTYYMDKVLIANNTIILDEDNMNSSGRYVGMNLQKLSNSRILNNAIELGDTTTNWNNVYGSNFGSAIYYQGPAPDEINNEINYNVYYYNDNSNIDAYRYVNTDVSGVVLDAGYAGEFSTLYLWQNWMKVDWLSTSKRFSQDLVKSNETFPKLRMRTDTIPENSPLEKRGINLPEAALDIDGINRNVGGQRYDIGAQYFLGKKLSNDFEVLNIIEPTTYRAGLGPFKDAEYLMFDNKPFTVKALVRNNGNNPIENKELKLRIYVESAAVNNANAQLHNKNFEETYYNNESSHYKDSTQFVDIPSTGTPFFEATANVSIPYGGNVTVEFNVTNVPQTYLEINQSTASQYTVPIHFSRMISNVTPRYKFVIIADNTNDEDIYNNSIEKTYRFFVKKSKRDMIVSAYNTYNNINKNVSGQIVPNEKVTNIDFVAGRLNLDSLISGLNQNELVQFTASESPVYDFDVIDRKAWDFRNIDFTLYRTLFISDELKIDTIRWKDNKYDFVQRNFQDKWFAKNITDFLNNKKAYDESERLNLVIASEEYISDIFENHPFIALNQSSKMNLVNNYYRAGVQIDSFVNENSEKAYFNKTAFYEIVRKLDPSSPPFDPKYIKINQPISFAGKSSTGRSLMLNQKFLINNTGWAIDDDIKDAEPYGVILKPISNISGSISTIGSILDTMTTKTTYNTPPGNVSMVNVPDINKIMSFATTSQTQNIVLLGFDWRHFRNIGKVIGAIDDYIENPDGVELPITLYGFDAKPIGNRVNISWNASNENTIDRFELEKANVVNNNAGSYNLIERVNSVGLAASDESYNTIDKNVIAGNKYSYRLKVVDIDGSYSYSDEKMVEIEGSEFAVSEITPNPVNSNSIVKIHNGIEQPIRISIYDLSGRELLVIADEIFEAGAYEFNINSSALSSGAYSLIVNTNGKIITKSFNVTK